MGVEVGTVTYGSDTLVELTRVSQRRARVEQTLAAIGHAPSAGASVTLASVTFSSATAASAAGDARSGLEPIVVDLDGSRPTADYRVSELLGKGGMGCVYAARATALDREVALKHLHPDAGPRRVAALLHEARVNGRLEHPNVVPVHAVGIDAALGPVVIMKRIRGHEWRNQLGRRDRLDPASLPSPIRVLIQVCNAVAHAHEVGLAHGDIKPRNIMIGQLGEVYLVDWGLAVDLRQPRASDHPIGTPAYMAPEMTRGVISVASDVYLLGATLFHVLYGHPPHHAPTAIDAMVASLDGTTPPCDPLVPDELRGICARAMALDPDDRYASAVGFRDALRGYLEHRGAEQLARAAMLQLGAFEERAASLDAEADASTAVQLQCDLDLCATRLSQALELWTENPRARRGLRRIDELRLEVHLARGNLLSARELAQRMRTIPPEAHQRLLRLEEEHALTQTARDQLENLMQDRSLSMGRRAQVGLALGLVAGLTSLGAWTYVARGRQPLGAPWLLVLLSGLVWLLMLAGVALRWRQLTRNFMCRLATIGLVAAPTAVFLHRLVAWSANHSSLAMVQVDLMLLTAVALTMAAIHRGFLLVAMGTFGSFVAACLFPEAARMLINLVPILAALCVVELWRRVAVSDQNLVDRVHAVNARASP